MLDTYHCPKCGALLERSGEILDPERGDCAVCQCDKCTIVEEMFGGSALTFLVDESGLSFDDATGEPL